MESTMPQRPAVPVPAVSGIDLTFRPRTYFGPLPLHTDVLAHVVGYHRRELLRTRLSGNNHNVPSDLTCRTLDESSRHAVARIHPMLMGGEYLPPFEGNETEIARISLASTTADQISVRARLVGRRIAYRIVDEYQSVYVQYNCQPLTSTLPLTLGALIAMIDASCEDGGAAISPIAGNFNAGVAAQELRHFVSVDSEFYPQLAAYYERRIEDWFVANMADDLDED